MGCCVSVCILLGSFWFYIVFDAICCDGVVGSFSWCTVPAVDVKKALGVQNWYIISYSALSLRYGFVLILLCVQSFNDRYLALQSVFVFVELWHRR